MRKEMRLISKNRITKVSIGWMIMILLSVSAYSYSQVPAQKPTRQSALDAFARSDFETALGDFNYLVSLYPKDPLYKYYSGVCLVKLGRDPVKAAALLGEAVRGSAGIRTVPEDGKFWYARALQMSGQYDKAVEAYNDYSAAAGKKTAREMGVPEYLQQSENGKGMIPVSTAAAGISTAEAAAKPVTTPEKPVTPPAVEYNDATKGKSETLPANDNELLGKALAFRRSSDSLITLAADARKGSSTASGAEKENITRKAESLETKAASLRDSADFYMAVFMKKPPGKSGAEAAAEKTEIKTAAAIAVVPPAGNAKTDPAKESAEVKEEGSKVKPQEKTPVFSVFEISTKPSASSDEKVRVNSDLPDGLVYRIQIAVFRNPVAVSYFKGITPITGQKNASSGVTTYYGGLFRRSADASKALTKVKSLGFKDSFVAAHMDKKQVSSERAAYLEKEWGTKPLFEISNTTVPVDTSPPTLVFRVEILRSAKPLTPDKYDEVKKLSGPRGLDVLVNDSKQNIYLIGKFFTYKSATEYADLLVRNGYKDARVVAYLGMREIPVDTARKLFEEY